MERKPLELIRELQRKNSELEKTKKRLEYQIQEMITKSAQRCAETDQKITELEIRIRDLEYENRELKSDKKELKKKMIENAPTTTQNEDVIDLDSNDEHGMEDEEDHEGLNLLEPLPSQTTANYAEQRTLPFTCNICSKSYLYQKRLETHMKIHQNVTKTSAKLPPPKSDQKLKADKKKTFVCNVKDCGYSTTFYPVMVRHKKAHTSELLSCDFYMCDYKTPYRKRYYNHMANKHGASLPNAEMDNDNSQDEEEDVEQFSVFTDLNSHLISSSMQDMDMGGTVKSRMSY